MMHNSCVHLAAFFVRYGSSSSERLLIAAGGFTQMLVHPSIICAIDVLMSVLDLE
jgi:hypothetical protein